jgi:uncharacterized protein YceH (UPF0502 family)
VLMLRGAQTPGELKQRTERLHPLADLGAVQATLERLIDRELAARLDRRPGQKEERYTHLMGDEGEDPTAAPAAAPVAAVAAPVAAAATDHPEPDPRIDRLETELAALRGEVGELRGALDALRAELGA